VVGWCCGAGEVGEAIIVAKILRRSAGLTFQ